MSKLISFVTGVLVFGLSCVSFILSYAALRDLAQNSGAVSSRLAWAWPLVIDGAMLVFSMTILRAALLGEHTWAQWLLVGGFSALSVGLNVAHAPQNIIAWIVAGASPVALLLSFESLMGQVRTGVRRRGVASSLVAMEAALSRARDDLADLSRQADARDASLSGTVAPIVASSNVKPVARDVFVTAYRDNGHTSVASLARELGVDARTAQRWVKSERVS